MYLNIKTIKIIEEFSFLIEEFFFKKNKWQKIKLPDNKIKIIAEDNEAKKLLRNPKFTKQVKNYLGVGYYNTEEKKKKILKEGVEIYLNVKKASDLAKVTLEYTDNFPKNKKEQEKILKTFFNRFTPFYDYGDGDLLAWDKKQQKLVDITHEEGDYKKIVLEPNSSKVVKWI